MNNALQTSDQQIYEMGYSKPKWDKMDKSVKLINHYLENSILHGNLKMNLNIANESMALLYEMVIEDVSTVLDTEFGKPCEQGVMPKSNLSPDELADRIVSTSTVFFQKYLDLHPQLSNLQVIASFIEVIGLGIDKGFIETRNILDEIRVLEGDTEKNIDTTYNFVQIGLQGFADEFVRSNS